MFLWTYSTLVRRSKNFFVWDGTRYLFEFCQTLAEDCYMFDTLLRHLCQTLLWDTFGKHWQMMHQALEDVMTKQNYSHHRRVVPYYAILCYTAIHEFAWIPQNDHIGSVRVVVWPRNVKPWNKFPCSRPDAQRVLCDFCQSGKRPNVHRMSTLKDAWVAMLLAVGISCILVPCFGPLWMNRNRFFCVFLLM